MSLISNPNSVIEKHIINGCRYGRTSQEAGILDIYDIRILKVLEENAELPLNDIGRKVGLHSPSAVSKRISKLKENGYIERITAKLNYEKLGFGFATMTLIEGKHRKKSEELLGEKLCKLPGVVAVHNTLGGTDFIVRTINRNMEEYTRTLDMMLETNSVERSNTRAIIRTFKDMDYSSIKLMEEDGRKD